MIKLPSLHCNSEYSFQESTIRLDELIKMAQKEKLTSLVITDHNNMFGAFEFVAKCEAVNIKPIIGLDLDVDDYRLILLAKNYGGFCSLCELSSKKMRGQKISIDDVRLNNVVVIDHPTKGFYAINKRLLNLENYFIATSENLSNAVAVDETRMLFSNESEALAILEAQASGESIGQVNAKPYRFEWDESKPQVRQIMEIIDDCNVVFPKNKNYLPVFKNPEGLSSSEYLKKIVKENFKMFFDKDVDKSYITRLQNEFEIIDKLNFADYFLIIWDVLKWAKNEGILVGPGRGSSAGSLIAYVLNITEVDPLKYDLLFERFLNPERVAMPDIDIDIQDSRRNEVIEYIYQKYGEEFVAQISTFSRLGPKSAIRDVARVMNIPVRDVNTISKLITDKKGDSDRTTSLKDVFANSTRFRALISSSEEYQLLFRRACLLEGLPRQFGTHPAGVVISSAKISNHFPTVLSSLNAFNQVQMPLEHLESNGLLKIDLLSLRNLTILQSIEKQIYARYNRRVNLRKIPLDDKLTNELLSSGKVDGIFQLENSYGMRSTLMDVGVSCFEDLVAIISLFRPGPMEQIKVYAKRKHGHEAIPTVDGIFDEVTKNTYGIIIYQEQIMQLAQRFASFSFAQADSFRRAISKKEFKGIDTLKKTFIDNAVKNGHSEELANHIFNLIQKFANYGFNKSHAVAYSLLTYRMAYLKARFPFEFFVAALKANLGSQEAIRRYTEEAKTMNIKVIPPSLNESIVSVSEKNGAIVLPLTIIKGFGEAAEMKVLEEKAKGPFVDFYDAVARLLVAGLGEGTIETLIRANTMRDFGNVGTLLDAFPQAVRYANLNTTVVDGQKMIMPSILPKPKIIVRERDILEEIQNEREIFGFQLSAFATTSYEKTEKLANLTEHMKTPLELACLIEGIRIMKDKNDYEYGIIRLSDSSKTIEASAFSQIWKFIEKTNKGTIVRVTLKAEIYNNKVTYQITKPWEVINE